MALGQQDADHPGASAASRFGATPNLAPGASRARTIRAGGGPLRLKIRPAEHNAVAACLQLRPPWTSAGVPETGPSHAGVDAQPVRAARAVTSGERARRARSVRFFREMSGGGQSGYGRLATTNGFVTWAIQHSMRDETRPDHQSRTVRPVFRRHGIDPLRGEAFVTNAASQRTSALVASAQRSADDLGARTRRG